MKRFFLILLTTIITSSAFAEAPSQHIRTAVDKVKQIVTSERGKTSEEVLDNKLRLIIEPMFNFDEMSKRSLGAYWAKANPAEQKEFVSLFSNLLARTYLKRIKRNAEDSIIEKMTDEIQDDKAMVKTIVDTKGDEITIDYRLALKDGQWKIYDVVIENVGLVSNYRNEFPAIIRKEGFSGLLARLKEKKDDNDAEDIKQQ